MWSFQSALIGPFPVSMVNFSDILSVLARFSAHHPSWDSDTTNKSKEPRGPAVATAELVKAGSSLVLPLQ